MSDTPEVSLNTPEALAEKVADEFYDPFFGIDVPADYVSNINTVLSSLPKEHRDAIQADIDKIMAVAQTCKHVSCALSVIYHVNNWSYIQRMLAGEAQPFDKSKLN